jgi:hypothetical protein
VPKLPTQKSHVPSRPSHLVGDVDDDGGGGGEVGDRDGHGSGGEDTGRDERARRSGDGYGGEGADTDTYTDTDADTTGWVRAARASLDKHLFFVASPVLRASTVGLRCTN